MVEPKLRSVCCIIRWHRSCVIIRGWYFFYTNPQATNRQKSIENKYSLRINGGGSFKILNEHRASPCFRYINQENILRTKLRTKKLKSVKYLKITEPRQKFIGRKSFENIHFSRHRLVGWDFSQKPGIWKENKNEGFE